MAGVLKLFVPGSTLNNFHVFRGPQIPLFHVVGTDWRSTGNPLAVRILDRGPHFEYP